MIKKLKYLLIVIPLILSITLIINISKYIHYKKEYTNLFNQISDYKNKEKNNQEKINNLTTEINNLKENKKDKIWEYDRWTKWNQEINSKIN